MIVFSSMFGKQMASKSKHACHVSIICYMDTEYKCLL